VLLLLHSTTLVNETIMKLTLSVFSLATVLFSHGIEAHGFVQQLRINGATYYDTWNPYKDPSKKLDRITRKFLDNGPVTDGAFLVSPSQTYFFNNSLFLPDRCNHLQLWCQRHR